jgi:hypothetical protein
VKPLCVVRHPELRCSRKERNGGAADGGDGMMSMSMLISMSEWRGEERGAWMRFL